MKLFHNNTIPEPETFTAARNTYHPRIPVYRIQTYTVYPYTVYRPVYPYTVYRPVYSYTVYRIPYTVYRIHTRINRPERSRFLPRSRRWTWAAVRPGPEFGPRLRRRAIAGSEGPSSPYQLRACGSPCAARADDEGK